MDSRIGVVTFPGQQVFSKEEIMGSDKPMRLGNGLLAHGGGGVVATKAGLLTKHASAAKYSVRNYQKRYVAVEDDQVIGVIAEKMGESFKVDIGTSSHAILSTLAFDGATKRNRPN